MNTVDYSKYIERTEGGKLDADLEEKFLMMCGQIKSGAVLMTENGKSVSPLLGTRKSVDPRDKAMSEALALSPPKSFGVII